MGDEQQDAEAAIDTLNQVSLEAGLRREIPVRILFARTKAGVKSRPAKSLHAQLRDRVEVFSTELHTRTAIAWLQEHGGTLLDLNPEEISGVPQAIANVELFVDEVRQILKGLEAQRKAQNARARKKSNPTVQMSVRLPELAYERFRTVARR